MHGKPRYNSEGTTTRMPQSPNNLIWIDLEMTGLDTQNDVIIEIATVVTDSELNTLAEGPVLAIHQTDEILNAMDDWNTKQHGSSGLTERVKNSTINEAAPICASQCLTHVWQQHLPGSSFSGPLHAGAGELFSLSQSGCQQSQGTGQALGPRGFQGIFQGVQPSGVG